MTDQLRAELLKIRTTRTTVGLVLGMIALVLLFVLLGGLLSSRSDLAQRHIQFQVIGAGTAATLFAALVGVMLVTTEFRYGTIRPTLLYEPRRPVVLGSKLGAGLLAGLVFGLVAEGLALAVGLTILSARDVEVAFTTTELVETLAGTAVAGALWAGIGVGLGALVRHQVGAIVGVLVYAFIAENIVFGLVPHVGRYLPGSAAQALAGDANVHLVTPLAGAALLVGYVAALAAGGTALTARRDVD